jgi:hypothetical protein
MADTNRRRFPRQNEDAVIQVLLTADKAEGSRQNVNLIPVNMRNQSRDGLYIETNCAFEPGSNISIKMISLEGDHSEKAYHMRDGQVIWCKQFDDSISRFGIGVKILRKVVQAEVLTSRFR